MDAARWRRIDALFDAACRLDPAAREPFLREACAGDEELVAEVLSLLAADAGTQALLDGVQVDTDALLHELTRVGEQIGPYRILRPLGRGGMGAVYLAERTDGGFEQQVALKLIKRGMDSEQILRRFESERQILARLQHPHIARLLDGGLTADGRPYFAMEYVDGEPIDQYCDRHRLSIDARLRLFGTVCKAVLYAHQNLVVHRDLKPDNIIVTEDAQGEPLVKLLDFGIAKLLEEDEGLTQTGMAVMTPAYASPEQVRGEPVSTSSDIYSLGVVLYELLAGFRPYQFESRSPAEVMRVLATTAPERPSAALRRATTATASTAHAGSALPVPPATLEAISQARSLSPDRLPRRLAGDLDVICLTALHTDPARRYDSAGRFLDDIHRHLTGQPVLARPDTVGYRLSKFVRRHRVGVSAAAAVILLVTGLVVFYTLQLRQEQDRVRLEAERTAQVAAFLRGIFEAPDPTVAQGEAVSARMLLDEGARRVADELADQPDVQVTMMDVIGSAYLSLGFYEQAEALTKQGLAIQQALAEASGPEAAALIDRLGVIRRLQGRYPEAEQYAREALALRRAALGDAHPDVAASLNNLAEALRVQGRYAEAEAPYREALTLRQQLLGPAHPVVADNLNNLALLLHERADYDTAEALHREALALRRAQLGEDHPDVSNSLHNLARTLAALGHYAEAEPLYQEALRLRRRTLGVDEPRTVNTLKTYGTLLAQTGAYDAAEDTLRAALGLFQQRLDAAHPYVLGTLRALAAVYLETDAYERADVLYQRVIAEARTRLGPEHIEVANGLSDRGNLLRLMRRYDEAEALHRQALALRRPVLGEAHPDLTTSLNSLAVLLNEQGRHAEAEPLFREALAIRRQAFGPVHPRVAVPLTGLAALTRDQGRLAEAEALYRESLDLHRATLPEGHDRIAHPLHGLGDVLLRQARYAEAEPLLREAYTIRRQALPPHHYRTATAASALGACLTALGRYAEAKPLLQDAVATLTQRRGPTDALTQRAAQRLEAWEAVQAP